MIEETSALPQWTAPLPHLAPRVVAKPSRRLEDVVNDFDALFRKLKRDYQILAAALTDSRGSSEIAFNWQIERHTPHP